VVRQGTRFDLVRCNKTVRTVQLDSFQIKSGSMNPSPIVACSSVRDRVLDAAETMAAGEGSANLTLDAVATAAGVSKGGLLYHFPSKDALLAAMIDRHVDRIEERCVQLRATLPGTGDCTELKAWVLSALRPDPATHATGAALFAAAASNPALLDCVRKRYADRVTRMAGSSCNFALAASIMLAVDGLVLAEIWRMSPYSDEQRTAIVDQLLRLADQAFGSAVAPEKQE
jgi:AcrR family transcriptional regulator